MIEARRVKEKKKYFPPHEMHHLSAKEEGKVEEATMVQHGKFWNYKVCSMCNCYHYGPCH